MNIEQYIDSVNKRFKLGNATEHSFRGDLQQLIESLSTDVKATNEPKRQACGAPDYIITRKGIPLGYIEAKDIGADLGSKNYKEQFDRYKQSLQNLIITDYLNFQLFREGILVNSISIGQIQGNKIVGKPEKYEEFSLLIKDFYTHTGQTIKSSAKLSKMMAAKARLLANVIERALLPGENANLLSEPEYLTLHDQFSSFKQVLLHEIKEKEFADIYAQTIAYGMFAARLHDPSLTDFSRQEAAELIPKSNPFLRKLFQYIAGYDLDDRIKWIVDDLADIFRATNVAELLKDFGKSTQQNDPLIHFYETFLSEYDPKLRKSRGVWYTPEPVVNFIVRAVDDILKAEFGLPMGLADTSKTTVTVNVQGQQVKKEVHKVQILDPATGTGTFLAEVVKQVYRQFEGQQGLWNNYVEEHLIPRLNGFEILMASYTIAHLKLDLLLRETGYQPTKDQRLKIYLTNSLEEYHPDTGTLFANWLSAEANEANHIKRDTPVMVVIGNPPYSVSSSNKSPWIENLLVDYKKDLNERNIQPLSDDYIKFIRLGQHFIEKNGSGILAFISNNSFVDGIIHRQMRKHLLGGFDKIYILNLHGNSKKKEVCPDGSPDQNVFDIMQGVSINLFLKTEKTKQNQLGQVFNYDLFGKRDFKYDHLHINTLKSSVWNELISDAPNFFMVKKYFKCRQDYEKGFKIDELFIIQSLGIEFGSKECFLNDSKDELENFIKEVITNPLITDKEIEFKNGIKTTSGWKFNDLRRKELLSGFQKNKIKKCLNAPFDIKYTYHSDILRRPQIDVLNNLSKDNIALITLRQSRATSTFCYFLADNVFSKDVVSILDRATGLPLYLYPGINNKQSHIHCTERSPNLNLGIVTNFGKQLGLPFISEKSLSSIKVGESFAPIDILDYIYAVLHSPTYREKYKEFLKIDFPRIPYPKDRGTFWQLVKLGGELRQIHLLESPVVDRRITTYPMAGNNQVEKVWFEISEETPTGKVWINKNQYFDGVPKIAWEFFIGGYQPAQKWLKDRKGRILGFEDILHYQKIVIALTETDRLMKEIDNIEIE